MVPTAVSLLEVDDTNLPTHLHIADHIMTGLLNGYLSAKFGYKKVILGALFFMNWFIFLPFFARSPEVLLVGQILCGLTWGVFATTGRRSPIHFIVV